MRRLAFFCCFAAAASSLFAEQPPIQVSSPHFSIVTDGGEIQARQVLDNFERMRWLFQTLYPQWDVDPEAPIVILGAKNRKTMQGLVPQAYLAQGSLNLAGLFMATPDKNYVLMRLDVEGPHPYSTVFHEYTHLQFRAVSRWMPIWLNEGLAQYFQDTEFKDKRILYGQIDNNAAEFLRQNKPLPLDILFRVDHQSPYYHDEDKGSIFYAESCVLTHYIEINDQLKGTHRLLDYMTRMSRNEDPVTAAQESFGDLKQLERELDAYLHQSEYTGQVLSSAAAPIDEHSWKTTVLTKPQFNAYRADFLVYVGRKDEAKALATEVLAADPKVALAHETMGFLELSSGNRDSARKWYGEAVELDSDDYLANYQFAAMSMSNPETSQDPRIETSLRAAIRINPNAARIYEMLGNWYVGRHEKLEDAQHLFSQAIQLDNSNLAYRLNAANLLMMRQDFDTAKMVLTSARKIARRQDQFAIIDSQLGQIAAIQKARAGGETVSNGSPDGTSGTGLPSADPLKSNAAAPAESLPAEKPSRPVHVITGKIDAVKCSLPSRLDLKVNVEGNPKPVALFTKNFFKLDMSAIGFTPKGSIDPCHEMGGMLATITYAESSDNSVDGQIVSIELRK